MDNYREKLTKIRENLPNKLEKLHKQAESLRKHHKIIEERRITPRIIRRRVILPENM
jgi:hypothetical protein